MHQDFTEEAWLAYSEGMEERYDFAACMRQDGSVYGTGGQCRKGSPTKAGAGKPDRSEDKAQLKATAARNKAERTRASGRAKNVQLNRDLAQDGPKPTGTQRQQAMKRLRKEQQRLEDRISLTGGSKASQARLKLVKSALREYEIDGKQRMQSTMRKQERG